MLYLIMTELPTVRRDLTDVFFMRKVDMQGPRNELFLGDAPCFLPFENATFLKKILELASEIR